MQKLAATIICGCTSSLYMLERLPLHDEHNQLEQLDPTIQLALDSILMIIKRMVKLSHM